jgi:EAL domain-containing protein (putative c-di-GMP-specific phosphodiesterase class I)
MTLENLLTSGFDFSKKESLLKFRYKLINAMFLVGITIATLAAGIRFSVGNTIVAYTDLTLALTFIAGFLYLRTDKSVFPLVTTIQLTLVFVLFSIVVLALPENHVKLLWYALLIIVSYMVKGIKGGLISYATSISALALFYIIPHTFPQIQPYIDLHLDFSEVVMAMLSYSTLALFQTFVTLHQQKSIDNLQKANKKIRKQQNQLYQQLRSFPTTKLPNSLALNEKLKSLDPNKPAALLTLAIDDFIILADEFGAEYAHKIVEKTTKILKHFTNKNISLYHVAPYQFSFLIENNRDNQETILAKKIKKHFEQIRLKIDKIEISISFSIGIAKENQSTLVTHANTALHEAQRMGINNYKLFTEDAKRAQEQKNNIYWNNKIKEVIYQHKLKLYYQPIINNHTQKAEKYECLIRAIDQNKVISPFLFLQAAKTRGLLPEITKFVIEESFRKFSENDLHFSINITEDDLRNNYLVDFLNKKSNEFNISPDRVYLEVLENITTTHTEIIQAQFKTLKNLGFGIAIDDFGAEASNLSRLLTYQADLIKIDGIFIKNLDTDINSIKIVETIVSLAQKLGAKTVAEFVHNETIYKIVRDLGVDYSQGYFFSAPMPDTLYEKELLSA